MSEICFKTMGAVEPGPAVSWPLLQLEDGVHAMTVFFCVYF